jgi:hypothetical protein
MNKTTPMKKSAFGFAGLLVSLFLFLNSAVAQDMQQPPPDGPPPASVVAPDWAPPYDNDPQTQYYYLPDIQCYYDVWHHEFVYMDNGVWLFSPVLPAMYAWYDLMHGHTVILDRMVHEPWRHHELYAAHYPRYYHTTVYPRGDNGRHAYGYNENSRKPIYDDKREASHPQSVMPARSQPVQYHDRNVGQPVHVEKNMMRPSDGRRK